MKTRIALVFFAILALSFSITAQDDKEKPVVGVVTVKANLANNDPLYQKIRVSSTNQTSFAGDYAVVNNLVLQKDSATFTLRSGEIYFLEPVEGRYTGAVFMGDGEFFLTPPNEIEKNSLRIFTETPDIKEPFSELVMIFTDKTFDEVKNNPAVKMSSNGASAAKAREAFREKENILKRTFRYNISSRILADFFTPARKGFFTTFINGKKFGKLVYQIDPLGIPEVYPEQVSLISYDEATGGIWTAFHLQEEYQKGTGNSWTDRRIYDLTKHDLDVTIDGTKLIVKDVVSLKMREPNVRFLPFDLFRNLRVKSVKNEKGEELGFIQENRNEDADFGVILPNAEEVGKSFDLTVEYEGNEALRKLGNGNFILIPRSTWYPNNPISSFGDRANFDLTFRFPKRYVLLSTGNRVGEETTEKDTKISKWSTEGVEYAVAGFNYGDFKKKEIKDETTGLSLEVYTNNDLPDEMRQVQEQIRSIENQGGRTATTLESLNTNAGADMVLTEAQNATRIYSSFFGKIPYKRIAMSQQPAPNFGQAWATLVYMPYIAFISSTHRVQLMGLRGGTSGFWREVAAHEVAHQWWGHIVGWTSYHDQWMSEGFSELSSSLFIQYVKKEPKKFIEFWEDQQKLITQASPATRDRKPYTVGPVTQGYRLNNAKTGNVARAMIYPKGAYILHMLRMFMFDHTGGTRDNRFSKMMSDFINTHYNQDVSTNDFKLMVEKHMTPEMNLTGDGKMDWFFNSWVYGADVPAYKLSYKLSQNSDGQTLVNGSITQSGVSDKFVMSVPLYMDFGNGWIYAGRARMTGNTTIEIKDLALPRPPKAISLDVYKDVLTTEIKIEK